MRTFKHLLATFMIACLIIGGSNAPQTSAAAAATTAAVQTGTIRCESRLNRYVYCLADTQNQVRIKQQLSDKECRKDHSWGYDARGVWVNRGCRADFEYGREAGGSNTARNIAIIAGAVGGAIAIGMILNNKKDKQSYDKLSEEGKAAFNEGYRLGAQDFKTKMISDPGRHSDRYDKKQEKAFKMGYKEGYENVPK